jgi:hypothetical protein
MRSNFLFFMHPLKFVVLFAVLTVLSLLSACGDERNREPAAEIATSATQVAVGDEIVVDGSASSDPDGDPLLFRWLLDAPDESAVDLANPRSQTITFIPDVPGTYTVHLSVDDGEFETPTKSVSIEVEPTQAEQGAPLADAGPDQAVEVGA